MRQVRIKKVSDKLTNVSVENADQMVSKLGSVYCSKISSGGYLLTAQSGTRRTVGTSLIRALVWNVGTLHVMLRENPISEDPRRGKVSMPVKGADHPVVVMKFL